MSSTVSCPTNNKVTCMFWSQKQLKGTQKKNIQNVLTNIKIIYIYLYIYMAHSKRMGRQLCTNKAPVVKWADKLRPDEAREMKENMRSKLKQREEPDQMESEANSATVWNGCSSQGRLRSLEQKRGDMGLGFRASVLYRKEDLTSSFKTCMWWRRHTEVSRLFPLFPIEFLCILNLISFCLYLLLYGKNKIKK